MVTIEYIKTSMSSNIRKTVNESFQTLRECQRFFKRDIINKFVSNIILTIDGSKYSFSCPEQLLVMSSKKEIEKHLEYYGNKKGLFKME